MICKGGDSLYYKGVSVGCAVTSCRLLLSDSPSVCMYSVRNESNCSGIIQSALNYN